MFDDHIAAAVELHSKLLDQPFVRHVQKAHRDKHQIGGKGEIGAGEFFHFPAFGAGDPIDFAAGEMGDLPVSADKRLGKRAPVSLAAFFLG